MGSGKDLAHWISAGIAVAMAALFFCDFAGAQQYNEKLFEGMKYRLVGPHRGGRSITAVGVVSEPNTYYFGAVSGGVWKTTNRGMDIDFDPSNPHILFAALWEARPTPWSLTSGGPGRGEEVDRA